MLNHDTALFYFFRVKIRRKCLRHRRKKVPDVFVAHIIPDLDRVVRLLLDRHSCLCLPAGAHCCGVAQGHHKLHGPKTATIRHSKESMIGGQNCESAGLTIEAGASAIVAGSAIFGSPDYAAAIIAIREPTGQKGALMTSPSEAKLEILANPSRWPSGWRIGCSRRRR
jgi:hypothetical protein